MVIRVKLLIFSANFHAFGELGSELFVLLTKRRDDLLVLFDCPLRTLRISLLVSICAYTLLASSNVHEGVRQNFIHTKQGDSSLQFFNLLINVDGHLCHHSAVSFDSRLLQQFLCLVSCWCFRDYMRLLSNVSRGMSHEHLHV